MYLIEWLDYLSLEIEGSDDLKTGTVVSNVVHNKQYKQISFEGSWTTPGFKQKLTNWGSRCLCTDIQDFACMFTH